MAWNLKVRTQDGSAAVSTITFPGVVPGTPSAAQTFRLVNDASAGAVDTAPNPFIQLFERDPATGEPLAQGLPGVDGRWVTGELTGVSSDDVDQLATGSHPIGRGRVLRTAPLPSGGWVEFTLRYEPPSLVASGGVSTRNFVLGGESLPAHALDEGHSEADRDGIIAGIGDGLHTELVIGGVITESGTPDSFVVVPDLYWLHEGVPQVKLTHDLELDEDDGSAVALAAGQGYWARLSVGAGPDVTVTKSDLFTTPGDPDDVPAAPAGEIDLGYVLRDFAAAIEDTAIVSRAWAGRFDLTWTAGLGVTIGAGWGLVDNALIRTQARALLTLTASQAEVSIWLVGDPGGAYLAATNDGSKPDPRAHLIWTVPTGATDVTFASRVDMRTFIGPRPVPVVLKFTGTLAAGLDAYGVWPFAKRGYLEPLRGLVYRWDTPGSGNAAGVAKADLFLDGTTAFTSSGTDDRRPSIDFDDDPTLDVGGLPEDLVVEPFAALHAELDLTVAFDATAPTGATLVALIYPT